MEYQLMTSLKNRLRTGLQRAYLRLILPGLRQLPLPSTRFGPVKGIHPRLSTWTGVRRVSRIPDDLGHDHWLWEYRPGGTVQVADPVAAIPDVPEGFRTYSTYEHPSTYVACIHGGRIATKALDVISPDDRVFGDLYQSSDGSISALSLIYLIYSMLRWALIWSFGHIRGNQRNRRVLHITEDWAVHIIRQTPCDATIR